MNGADLRKTAFDLRDEAVKRLTLHMGKEDASQIVDAILGAAKANAHAVLYDNTEWLKRALREKGVEL